MTRNIILFDAPELRENLLPITFTRPIADIRFGIMTIREKWEKALPGTYSYSTVDYLSPKFPINEVNTNEDIYIAGNVCPSPELVKAIEQLPQATALTCNGTLIAHHGKHYNNEIELDAMPLAINSLPDIFMLNEQALADDYRAITAGRVSQPLSPTCTLIGSPVMSDGTPAIFIEEGATVEARDAQCKPRSHICRARR